MAFEHYRRNGTKMLRCGYTTGTCAALAAAAATRILLTGRAPETVSLMTAKGIPVEVAVEEHGAENLDGDSARIGEAAGADALPVTAWAAIPKDAGDDADVTDGLLIRADVTRIRDVEIPDTGIQETEKGGSAISGILIDGGTGVGRVTKPGLDQPPGNAAINSGPRRMIEEAVRRVCEELDYDPDAEPVRADCADPSERTAAISQGGLRVIISVPEGEAAAKKTFNSKLGIEGGISILGTSGIVEPMSEQALVDTIEVELKQIAIDSRDLIIAPGNYGTDYIAGHDLDRLGIPVLKFSNFLGETLDMIAGTQIERVLLVAHVGKLSKVAAGVMNTHSKYADGRNEIFCAHAAVCGGSTSLCKRLMEAATTDACIELLDQEDDPACSAGMAEHQPGSEGNDRACSEEARREHEFRDRVVGSILKAVQEKLEHRIRGEFRIGALMFSNVYGLLGMTEQGEEILQKWEEEHQ